MSDIRLRRFAVTAAAGLLVVATFQVALAFGAPLGRASWGGKHRRLPRSLRVGSAMSAAALMLGALVVLRTAGYPVPHISYRVSRSGTRLLSAAMALSALGNFASSSRWERFVMGPVALLLSFLCMSVTRTAGRLHDPAFG